ncbi:PspC domain-containing protein [Actinomadura meridiana]|uniref:PspC domain-containing protein n=1 Tax=Actinomadura meridiana TaxID=559626 RepID=A0ABP8CA03_9ACTN
MNGLYRPRHGRMIAGVCAGLARRFGLSSTTVRLLFLLSCLLPGPQFVVYLVLWVMMPSEERRMAGSR